MNLGDLLDVGSGAAILIALVSIAFGLLNCFFGYRIFKVMLGIYGFLLGALVGALVAGGLAGGQTWVLLVGAIVGGIVGAALMVLLYLVGVFVVGALAGVLLANAVGAALGFTMPTWVVIILAVVVGIVALILQRAVLILATALSGAWAVVSGGASLLPGHSLSLRLVSPSGSWKEEGLALSIMLAAWLVLGIVGALVQFRTTAEKEPTRPAPASTPEPHDRW
jgi:hypothetical protein